MGWGVPIVIYNSFAPHTLGNCAPQRLARIVRHEHCHHSHNAQQNKGFDNIGPHHTANTSAQGIEPSDGHRKCHIHSERHAPRIPHHRLQHHAHKHQSHGASQQFAHKKEPRTATSRRESEALFEVLIDRHHSQAVVQRHQHPRDNHLTRHKSERHLEVCKILMEHHSWHRHESDTRHRGANTSQCYGPHILVVSARKVGRVIATTSRTPRHHHQQTDVSTQDKSYTHRGHRNIV